VQHSYLAHLTVTPVPSSLGLQSDWIACCCQRMAKDLSQRDSRGATTLETVWAFHQASSCPELQQGGPVLAILGYHRIYDQPHNRPT
jgi:hypothetical protein